MQQFYTCNKKSLRQRVKQASFVGNMPRVHFVGDGANMVMRHENIFDFSGNPDKKLDEYILTFPKKALFEIVINKEVDIINLVVTDVILP